MPTYVALINWTDEGRRNFAHTLEGYKQAQAVLSESGVSFVDIYWTTGEHDLVGVVEGPDDQTVTSAMLAISSLGGIRATATRAFNAGEIGAVLTKATTMAGALAAADAVQM